jgi:glucose/arabinose dehydrogenase
VIHDGGRLRVGPDQKLYLSAGDATVPQSAQDPAKLSGKLLRIGLDGEVPPDNPSASSLVFLSGVRNSEGFDWLDPHTLAIADHGPSGDLGRRGLDELNVAKAGNNLGWPTISGCDTRPGLVSPVLSWVPAVPPGGLVVYRAHGIPGWTNSILMGTLSSRHLHRVVLNEANDRVVSHEVYFRGDPPGGLGRIRDVTVGPDGQLYLTTSNCDGRGTCPSTKDAVIRIVAG